MTAHILIVDDQADLTTLFKGFFASVGFRVSVANDGFSALDLDESDPVDILVTDLTMPGMSGQELIMQLRQRRPALPIIVMSGYGDDDSLADANTMVMSKPVSLVLLKQHVEEMLARQD